MQRERLNNFQRQKTARWLLNISQAAVVGGAGIWFIPGVRFEVATLAFIGSMIIAALLYLLAMDIGKEIKDAK